jgi:diguanylate cyclase (GGDEF)-like protein/PAS domain S-box-containing protein
MYDENVAPELVLEHDQTFEEIANSFPGAVWIAEEGLSVRYVNQGWREFSGLSNEQSLGSGWLVSVHPEDTAKIDAAVAAVADDGSGQCEITIRLRRHDDAYRWCLLRTSRFVSRQDGFRIGCAVDIHERVESEARDREQLAVLEMVAKGAAIDEILTALCRFGEMQIAGAKCTIMLVDETAGIFTHVIAPSLPQDIFAPIIGMPIGPSVGSCGTAASERRDVVAFDTSTNPHWKNWRDVADAHSLRACWSRPVLASDGRVLATFGFYFDEPRSPTEDELERLRSIQSLASVSVERVTVLDALRESEEHHRQTVELSPQIPWTADPQGAILTVSSRWIEFTGITPEDGLGAGWLAALHPDDIQPTQDRWGQSLRSGLPYDVRFRVSQADGGYRWARARAAPRRDENGGIVRWYGTLEDVHDHYVAEEKLRIAAFEDALTNLPNRRSFERELVRQTKGDVGSGGVGLIVLDIDEFKQVNDQFGHDAGDNVLRLFAQQLQKLTQPEEFAARLGGDEFAVIVPGPITDCELFERADALGKSLDVALRRAPKLRNCRTSIGCVVSRSGENADDLFKKADLALYASKAERRGAVRLFSPAYKEANERKNLEISLARRALEGGWIIPYYQPKVSLPDGAVVGFEALLRIDHPEKGILPPIAVKEALDHPLLGHDIGDCMINRVLADLKTWGEPMAMPPIAINMSGANLSQSSFSEALIVRLEQNAIPASLLTLEITERVFLDHMADALALELQRIRERGMGIALDDFGTGFASLTHLQKFPVSEIKIDRSFIEGLHLNSGNAAIVKAMIALGRNIGMDVVAEGVQSADQGLLLHSWGCRIAQGFHYGRPMPITEATDIWMLHRDRHQPARSKGRADAKSRPRNTIGAR